MVYSIEELKQRIAPVAEKYGLREVYLFGSYACSEATEQSDVDILIDRTGSKIYGIGNGSLSYSRYPQNAISMSADAVMPANG